MRIIENIWTTVCSFWSTNSGEFISALAGAFFGALAAYWFQRWSEKKKDADSNHAAILKAQLALISQINVVENFRRQHLDPLRNDPARDFKMLLVYKPTSHLSVDFDSIAFFLAKKDPNILMHVQVAERCFHSAMDAIDARNETMREMHSRSDVQRADIETGHFTIKADPRDIKLLRDNTAALYHSVDYAEEKLSEAIVGLKKAGKAIFPKRHFLSIEFASKVSANTDPKSTDAGTK